MKYLAIVVVLLLAGCSDQSTPKATVSYGLNQITEINLSDGTHCAIYDGYHQGGMTCNWK